MKTLPWAKIALVKRVLALAGAAVLLGMAGEARGQVTDVWTGNFSADWNDAGNWLTAVPTSIDEADIDTNAGFQPILNGGTGAANFLDVGITSTGSGTNTLLTVLNAGVLTAGSFTVGDQSGATGAIIVGGGGSQLLASGTDYVGAAGNGTLTVTLGAQVSAGALYVGDAGTGNLSVTNGGNVTVGGALMAGNQFGSVGTVTVSNGGNVTGSGTFYIGDSGTGNATVDGAGSTLSTTSTLYVGNDGNGTLTVSNGGNVTAGSILESANPGVTANITVTGANATLSTTGSLYDGLNGNGTLTVSNGGKFSGSLSIGVDSGSTSIATVDGAGSSVSAADVNLGNQGNGTLIVSNGGNVTASSQFSLGNGDGGAGTLSVDGLGSVAGSNGFLLVGGSGSGVANVTNGGALDVTGDDGSEGVYLGYGPGESSSLLVSGVNSVGNVSSTLNVTEGGVTVGFDGNGTLTVADGGVANFTGRDSNSAGLVIGQQSDGTGSVTVTGVNPVGNLASTLNVTQAPVLVGYGGNGTLTVADGAVANFSGTNGLAGLYVGYIGDGNVTVTGVDAASGDASSLQVSNGSIRVGFNGNGALNILAGGNASTPDNLVLGTESGSNGTVAVDGLNSSVNVGGVLVVGDSGGSSGGVSLTNDGLLVVNFTASIFPTADFAEAANSTATLTISDATDGSDYSTLEVAHGALYFGDGGNATGEVSDGGLLLITGEDYANTGLSIANQFGSTSTLTASGYNTTTGYSGEIAVQAGAIVVGQGGNGTLAVVDGGNVNVTSEDSAGNSLYVGNQTDALGNVTVSGGFNYNGTFNRSELQIYNGGAQIGNGAPGSLTILGGGLFLSRGADAHGNGMIIGNQPGVAGNVTVSGVDATSNTQAQFWLLGGGGALVVGYQGNGTLTVDSGGLASLDGNDSAGVSGNFGALPGSNANITVSGYDPDTLIVTGIGTYGGALVIGNGGNATYTQSAVATAMLEGADAAGYGVYIGNRTGATGTATITGGYEGGSFYLATVFNVSGAAIVGNAGTGALTVSSGAFAGIYGEDAANIALSIGNQTSGIGNVTVTGADVAYSYQSQLDLTTGAGIVGNAGNGTLGVYNGGLVLAQGMDGSSVGLYVGNQAGSNGTVIVSGVNSGTDNVSELDVTGGALVVGNSGTGTFTVADGGLADVTIFVELAQNSGGNGTLNVESNGTLEVGGANGIVAGTGTSTFNLAGGIVQVTGSDLSTSVPVALATNTTSSINTNGFNATFSGVISGAGALVVSGAGTTTFSMLNTYTGATNIESGTIALVGAGSLGSGALTLGVSAGTMGTLDISGAAGNVTLAQAVSGNGTFATGLNTLNINTSLSPGFGSNPGLVSVTGSGGVNFGAGSTLNFKIIGAAAGDYDQISLGAGSDLNFTPGSMIALATNYTPSGNDTITLVALNGGSITGTPDFTGTSFPGGYWDTSDFDTTGEITAVPEPAAFGLILGGLALVMARASSAGRKRLGRLV
jgi:T5SS/PEP-CTERM-associated repeat protein